MVVTCEKCSTKFNLDASRLPPDGGNVRCTKCGQVFSVKPPKSSDVLPDRITTPPAPSSSGSFIPSLANNPLISPTLSSQQQRKRIFTLVGIVLLGFFVGILSTGASLNPKKLSLLFNFGKTKFSTGVQVLSYQAKIHFLNPNQQILWLDGTLFNPSKNSSLCPNLRLTLYSFRNEFVRRISFKACEDSLEPNSLRKFSFQTDFSPLVLLGSYQVSLEP